MTLGLYAEFNYLLTLHKVLSAAFSVDFHNKEPKIMGCKRIF